MRPMSHNRSAPTRPSLAESGHPPIDSTMTISVLSLLVALHTVPSIEILDAVDGPLLIAVADRSPQSNVSLWVLRDGESPLRLRLTPSLRLAEAVWGENDHEVLVPTCAGAVCRIGRYQTDGTLLGTIPSNSSQGMVEPDGRVKPWKLRRPRVERQNGLIAASNDGELLVFDITTDTVKYRGSRKVADYTFGPGGRMALSASPVPDHDGYPENCSSSISNLAT